MPKMVDDNLVVEVPVVDPNKTVQNVVSVTTVVVSVIMLLANRFSIPLSEGDIATLMSAGGVIVGVFMWLKNRYWDDSVTMSTATRKGLKLRLKEDWEEEQ